MSQTPLADRAPLALVALTAGLLTSSVMCAADVTWDANGTAGASAWLNAINWNPDVVPGSTDTAVFSTNAGASIIGIAMSGTTNNGAANQIVGAISLSGGENKTITNSTTANGTLTLAGIGGTLLSNSSAFDLVLQNGTGGNGTMDVALASSGRISVTSTGLITISSRITESGGSFGIEKTGSGQLVLSGANTYSGGTTLTAGTLQLSGVGTLGSTTSSLTVNGGTLNLNATSQMVGALNGTGGTITNAGNANSTLTIGNGGASGSYTGIITNGSKTLSLVKTGAGSQVLNGNNTYTGTSTVSAGTLQINNAGTAGKLSNTSGITLNSSGTLLLSGSSSVTDRINDSATFTLNGGTFKTGGLSEGAAGTNGIGALTLTANSTIDFALSNTSVIQFAGVGTQTDGQILQIINWDGNHNGGGSGDRLLFAGNNTTAFTNEYSQTEVSFNGILGYNIYQFSGYYEVTAVPEPETWFGAGLALLTVLYIQRRRCSALKIES